MAGCTPRGPGGVKIGMVYVAAPLALTSKLPAVRPIAASADDGAKRQSHNVPTASTPHPDRTDPHNRLAMRHSLSITRRWLVGLCLALSIINLSQRKSQRQIFDGLSRRFL